MAIVVNLLIACSTTTLIKDLMRPIDQRMTVGIVGACVGANRTAVQLDDCLLVIVFASPRQHLYCALIELLQDAGNVLARCDRGQGID